MKLNLPVLSIRFEKNLQKNVKAGKVLKSDDDETAKLKAGIAELERIIEN